MDCNSPGNIEEYKDFPAFKELLNMIHTDFEAFFWRIYQYDMYWIFKVSEPEYAAEIKMYCENIRKSCLNFIKSALQLHHDGADRDENCQILNSELLDYAYHLSKAMSAYTALTKTDYIQTRHFYMNIATKRLSQALLHQKKAFTLL